MVEEHVGLGAADGVVVGGRQLCVVCVQPRVAPEIVRTTLRAGDILMLCSDGLTGPLPDDMILDIMLKYEDPVRCCRDRACA